LILDDILADVAAAVGVAELEDPVEEILVLAGDLVNLPGEIGVKLRFRGIDIDIEVDGRHLPLLVDQAVHEQGALQGVSLDLIGVGLGFGGAVHEGIGLQRSAYALEIRHGEETLAAPHAGLADPLHGLDELLLQFLFGRLGFAFEELLVGVGELVFQIGLRFIDELVVFLATLGELGVFFRMGGYFFIYRGIPDLQVFLGVLGPDVFLGILRLKFDVLELIVKLFHIFQLFRREEVLVPDEDDGDVVAAELPHRVLVVILRRVASDHHPFRGGIHLDLQGEPAKNDRDRHVDDNNELCVPQAPEH